MMKRIITIVIVFVLFTHFSNPLFVIGTIGTLFLGSSLLGLIILVCHITANFIIGIIFRKRKRIRKQKINFKKALNGLKFDNNIGNILSESILSAMNTMFLLLGIITIFLIFTTLIKNTFKLPSTITVFIFGMLEMTQGIKYASLLNASILYRSILMLGFISFGGFSVHMQVFSILGNTKIKYRHFFFSRILQVIISILLLMSIFIIFNIN